MKLNWKNTFVIGLGFFGISLVWPIYNAYMPILYDKFIGSKALIGGIMTIDNWLALTLIPFVGFLSDRTRTRFGRRIPFLLFGAPLAAVFLFLIPTGWSISLGLLVTFTVLMNLSMASFRSPIVALMPDITPPPLRSRANGIINFMGGLGYIVASFGGALLYRLYPGYPFYAAGVLLIAVTLAFYFWIREPQGSTEVAERFVIGKVRNRNALLMLMAIFFWFVSYNSVETWLTTYGKEHLGLEVSSVAILLTFTAAAFLLMAIPAGFVAEGNGKIRGLGRKWTILLGIAGMMVGYGLLGLQSDLSKGWPFLILAGISWALININSYPAIVQMAPEGQTGTYTGLYYLFSSGGQIAGPPIFGAVFDNLGYTWFFPMAIGFMFVAGVCMFLVGRNSKASGDMEITEAAD